MVWPECTAALMVSNDGGFSNHVSVTPASSVDWTLDSTGPERLPRTVYVRFGASTQNYTDDIILDQTAPTISAVAVRTTRTSAREAPRADRAPRSLVITTKAADAVSGLAGMQITANRSKPGKVRTFVKTVKARIAGPRVWVRVQDRAGNFSAWRSARAH